jgi:hypothetical protein
VGYMDLEVQAQDIFRQKKFISCLHTHSSSF